MVQMPAGATGALQVLVSPNGPLAVMEAKVSEADPLLVTVTICAGLVVFTGCEAKVSVAAESVTAGSAAPVPVSRTIWGLLGALSVRVSEPTLCPAAVGVNVTPIVQFEGGDVGWSATVQELLATAKLPLAATAETVRAAVPVFDTVRSRGALATPTFWVVLKARLEDDRVTIGAAPAVPVKSTTCASCAPPVSVSVKVI
jgi:hypothetical protein